MSQDLELLELLQQALFDSMLTCPKCENNLEADADKCFECGWINRLKKEGYI